MVGHHLDAPRILAGAHRLKVAGRGLTYLVRNGDGSFEGYAGTMRVQAPERGDLTTPDPSPILAGGGEGRSSGRRLGPEVDRPSLPLPRTAIGGILLAWAVILGVQLAAWWLYLATDFPVPP